MGDVSLTLNQDKRRRFDSYPGSISAGGALLALAERVEQEGNCTLRCALTVREAAYRATRAAVDARLLGADVETAQRAHDGAYAEAVA